MTREQFEKLKKTNVAVPCMYQYMGARKGQKCFPSWFVKDKVIIDGDFVSYKSVDLL